MAENQDQNGVDQASVVSQVARMLSIVLKNTEVQGAVQTQPAIETGAASFLENTLISRTLNRLGIRVSNNTTPAELAESDVDRQRQEAVREPTTQTIQSQNSSEIDSQLAALPNAILEEVQQTNELSEEDIETLKNLFPALFNRALDSHPDIHVVNLPFPDTRPVAGFDTTSIYSGRVFLDDEIQIINTDPLANNDFLSVTEDSISVQINVLANDRDADNDVLTVTAASASNGIITINANGTLSYTPTANFTGTDTISYTISDGNGGSSSAKVVVVVTAVNDAPVAVDDIATVVKDSNNNTITVLTNDVDLDGDTLTVTSASATNGTVSINVNGTLSYTPTANFTGTDTISYAISDGNGGSSSADVTVVVSAVNDAPDISNESAFISETSINPSTSVSGTLTFNDVDGDALVFTLSEPAEQIYSAGNLVTWVGGNTQTVIGSALGNEVLRATIDNSGNYTITLSDAIDHPDTVTQDTLNLTIDVNATDGVATSVGELTVTVEDDVPTVSDSSTLFTIDGANLTATGNVFGASGEYGSDGGFVSTVKIGGYNYSYDASTNGVSQSGYSEVVSGYSYDTFNHELTINTYKGETLVVDVLTGDYNYSTSGVSGSPASTPSDPVVSSSDSGGLLGIVGADLLGLIDFSTNQAVTAYDADNDITQVIVRADQAISLSLGAYYELSFSTELANEFGLTLSLTDDKADVLGVTTQTFSQLTITATDGGSIDNSALNEFLATLYIEQFGLLNLALTPSMSISATDSRTVTVTDASIDLLGLSLLGTSSVPAEIQYGTNADDVMTGSASDDRMYGYSGSDNLSGLAGNDLLRGGAGSDTLNGGSGNDILLGGAGSDLLSGGTGIDVFKWEEGDLGGTDQITDFDTNPLTTGGDILDLKTLLNGEGSIGASAGNLTNYLHFELSGVDTVIYISSNGSFSGGYNPAFVDHTIVINNNDLIDNDDDQHIIESLLKSGKLIVDEADNSTSMLAGYTEVDYVITDGDGDIVFHESIFDSSGKSDEVANSNTAPYVQVSDETLLGLVGISALNHIDFSDQDINAGDVDGNLQSVTINYTALLGLGAYSLTASSSLAAELGLQIDKVDDSGFLGLVNPSSTLVITAIDGGTIDNQAINELLATVNFENGGGLIPQALLTLNVLNATTVTAVDDLGASTTLSVASLADINALDSLAGNANIHVGTAGNDVISASVENNRLYGYAGDDQLSGGQGADLLRGGSGNDQLIGDADNDLIIGGTGDDQLTGGIGIDVFRWEKGDEGTTLVPSNDTVTDFSVNEDVLDLSSVLINEENGDITHYLDFNFDGSDTVISVSIDGVLM